jgi:vacuolar-type H+-ATPase subunit I/STV1
MKNADGSDLTLQQLVAIIQHEIKHHEERKRRLELNQYSPLPASFWDRDEPTFSKDMQDALHKLMVGFPNIGQPKPFLDSDESKAPLKQTVENLQKIMARDGELIREMDKEIKQLRDKNQRLADRLAKPKKQQKESALDAEQDLALNKLGQMRARKHLFYVDRKGGKL